MGCSSGYSTTDYHTYRSTTNTASATSASQVYTATTVDDSLNPKNITVRESCDFDGQHVTPIIIGMDVTGSMDDILYDLAMKGMPKIMEELFTRKPIEFTNVMGIAIGDYFCDSHPLQMTQFESDVKIIQQTDNFYLERGGGGNNSEGYIQAWLTAVFCVKADHIDKRHKKGYIFTFGDDGCTPSITPEQTELIFGRRIIEKTLTAEELYIMASRDWNIYHIHLDRGRCYDTDRICKSWRDVIGERFIILNDYKLLPETIVSLIQMNEKSMSVEEVVNTWDNTTAMVLKNTLPAVKKDEEVLIVF